MHAAIAADTDKYIDLDFLSHELQLLCALTGAVLPVAKLIYAVHTADWFPSGTQCGTKSRTLDHTTGCRTSQRPQQTSGSIASQGPVKDWSETRQGLVRDQTGISQGPLSNYTGIIQEAVRDQSRTSQNQ